MLEAEEIRQLVMRKLLELANDNKILHKQVCYSLSAPGKYIRPVLVFLTSQIFQESGPQTTNAALALELFHTFTLVHDDIIDQSALRRNKPTVQAKWDVGTAVLTGDTLLILAYKYLNLLSCKNKDIILTEFLHTSLLVCQGQEADLAAEYDEQATSTANLETYLRTISLKTAVLLGFSLQLGALLSDAVSYERSKDFFAIGRSLGVAFQLQDDLLDLYPDSAFGKTVGCDLMLGKTTILNLVAQQYASPRQLVYMKKLQMSDEGMQDKIRRFKEICDEIGVKDRVIEQIKTLEQESIKKLEQLPYPRARLEPLKNTINNLFKYQTIK